MKRLPELIPLIPSLPFSFWEEGGEGLRFVVLMHGAG